MKDDDDDNTEKFDLSGTNDVVDVETLAARLSTVLRKNYYEVFVFPFAPIPFCTVKEKYSSIQFHISVDNTLDIERSNLITEYLGLDHRVKPFLFALRQFVKRKEINNGKSSHFLHVNIIFHFKKKMQRKMGILAPMCIS